MNRYKEMKDRHQREVNAFPFGFAFGEDQFTEMMKKWGMCHGRDGKPTKNDCSKIVSIGAGGFVRKSDLDAMHEMFSRHQQEMKDAILADKEGTGFVYEMFRYEMGNHEYGYTCDPNDTLVACGLNMKQVQESPALAAGWMKAQKEIMKEYADDLS